MRSSLRWALFLGSVLASPLASAASFDCDQATTAVEHWICDTPELSHLDDRLDGAWRSTLRWMSADQRKLLRTEQRDWMAKRNECVSKQQDVVGCLSDRISKRIGQLQAMHPDKHHAFDQVVASIPHDPAGAAKKLMGYDSPLASAWLAYLHRFEPGAGVDAVTAKARFQQARRALRAVDEFPADILDDKINNPKSEPGEAELLLLRLWIEREQADDHEVGDDDAYCFVFARHGELAYETFGPLYGSTRDAFSPICPPQGDLFDLPAWKNLLTAIKPTFGQYGMYAGTIRFATFADWRVIQLRATVSPLLYLSPALRKRYDGDAKTAIQTWNGEGQGDEGADVEWPDAQRKQALALLSQVCKVTADWLVQHKQLEPAQARQAAAAIVDIWVIAHLQSVG